MTVANVLIVEDEPSIRDVLVELFEIENNDIVAADNLAAALIALRARRFDLIVTDLRLAGKRDGGLQVVALASMLSPEATVLVLTGYADEDNRQASFRLGALHFLEKPVDLTTISRLASQVGIGSSIDSKAS